MMIKKPPIAFAGHKGAKNSAPFPSMVVIFVDASGKVF